MKPNKIISIITILLLTACSEMLIEEPRDIMDPSQFFNTDAEAIGAVNGIYSRGFDFLYGTGTNRSYMSYSHWGTDIARPTGGREANFPPHVYTLSSSEDANIREHWEILYRTIADANLVIENVERTKNNFSPDVYNQTIGEAKVLRALMYYVLTNYFGDVPMWLEALKVGEVSTLSRTPVNKIYDQMIVDLEDAANKLPSSYQGPNKGRASKWAAMMLLTKYYLIKKDWNNAKITAGKIVNESPHVLLPDYGAIFSINNEYNDEIIWEKDAVRDIYPTWIPTAFTPRAVDEPRFSATEIDYQFNGFGLLSSSNEFVGSFDPDDKRKPLYNFNGFYDDPDGDGIYDRWIQLNNRYVEKMLDHGSPRLNSGKNIIVYRLADAYLMYAEAENELNGPTSEAYSKINSIRDRAFDSDPAKRLSGLSKEEFRQAIMDERKWELAFEFHRRWDLKRWGKLGEAVQSMAESNPLGAANFKPYHDLWPIPFDEIILNPNLTQNPGY
ncbi:RagB/SusD family nutrient uptake outer membrane protein [Aquiflexum sp.]|uniref:RagB/SusD family nutrient uptake outer membrane protein n=1 Tax=Aquiflexum sp. TaxID=1872584 RepID=UPI003594227C